MELKYIYNEQGEKESVIVPIEEWYSQVIEPVQTEASVELRINELHNLKAAFKGISSAELISELETMRNEWERNI